MYKVYDLTGKKRFTFLIKNWVLDLCLESISFLDKVNKKFSMSSCIIGPFTKKKLAPSKKVTPSEKGEKGTHFLNDMEELVVTIRRKD